MARRVQANAACARVRRSPGTMRLRPPRAARPSEQPEALRVRPRAGRSTARLPTLRLPGTAAEDRSPDGWRSYYIMNSQGNETRGPLFHKILFFETSYLY